MKYLNDLHLKKASHWEEKLEEGRGFLGLSLDEYTGQKGSFLPYSEVFIFLFVQGIGVTSSRDR